MKAANLVVVPFEREPVLVARKLVKSRAPYVPLVISADNPPLQTAVQITAMVESGGFSSSQRLNERQKKLSH